MLKERVEDKLNSQMNAELYSAYLYFSMAAYFESINLKGFANWVQVQAQEELTHVLRVFNYVNDKGGRAKMAAVDAPPDAWDSPLAVVQKVYEHECSVSELINECVSLAIGENDYSTHTFLQWFVAEQVEEEAAADDILQKLKLIGDNSSGLYLLDSELGSRRLDPGALAPLARSRGGE